MTKFGHIEEKTIFLLNEQTKGVQWLLHKPWQPKSALLPRLAHFRGGGRKNVYYGPGVI